jgi:hypothetical protein
MFRRAVAVAVLCAVVPGCFTAQSKKLRYTADGAVAAMGAYALTAAALPCDPSTIGCTNDLRMTLAVIGAMELLLGASLIISTAMWDPNAVEVTPPPEPTTIPDAASIPAPATSNPELRQLTFQASVAARVGQCAAVQTIARRVATIDVDYREHGFASDARVAGCLP